MTRLILRFDCFKWKRFKCQIDTSQPSKKGLRTFGKVTDFLLIQRAMGSVLSEKTQFGAQMHMAPLFIQTQKMMMLSSSGSDLSNQATAIPLIMRI